MTVLGSIRRGRRRPVDVTARLARPAEIVPASLVPWVAVPLTVRPAPFRPGCAHFVVDVRVDVTGTCAAGHPEHPGRACVLCEGVVDVLAPDRTVQA